MPPITDFGETLFWLLRKRDIGITDLAAAYTASKHVVDGFTETLRNPLPPPTSPTKSRRNISVRALYAFILHAAVARGQGIRPPPASQRQD